MTRVSENLKSAAVRECGLNRKTAHGGVKEDSAYIKFCQELGRPCCQHDRESEEAIVVTKQGNSCGAKGLYIRKAE